MVVKTAQVWTQSKFAREMLCFTIETAVGGREGRMCPTGGCGLCPRYVRAMFALCPRYVRAMFALCSRYVRARSQWQESSELAERKAMCGILLGNATADC